MVGTIGIDFLWGLGDLGLPKYAGGGQWFLAVTACFSGHGPRKLQITVETKGPGGTWSGEPTQLHHSSPCVCQARGLGQQPSFRDLYQGQRIDHNLGQSWWPWQQITSKEAHFRVWLDESKLGWEPEGVRRGHWGIDPQHCILHRRHLSMTSEERGRKG